MSRRDALRSYRRAYRRVYRVPPAMRWGAAFRADFVEMGRRGDRVVALLGDVETEVYGQALTSEDVRALQRGDA